MKFNSIIAALTLLSGSVFAQQVTTTAKGPASIVSSQTGNLQLRHYWFQKENDDKKYSEIMTQVRGNFTAGMFNDKVESTLTLGTQTNVNDRSKMDIRTPRVWVDVFAYDSDYFALTPYAEIIGLRESDTTNTELGIYPTVKMPTMATASGDFTAQASVYLAARLSSESKDQQTRNLSDDQRTALTGSESSEEDPTLKGERGVAYYVMYNPSVTWETPAEGLSLKVFGEWHNNYEPIRDYKNGEEKTVYIPTRDYDTFLQVSYKVNDQLALDNFIWRSDNGFFEENGNSEGSTYTNLARVTYTMY